MVDNNLDLEELKYSELQKLAKSLGIKANVKVERLRKALKEHYTKNQEDTNTVKKSVTQSSSSEHEESGQETSPPTKKSRGRGKRGRGKKTTGSATDSNLSEDDKTEEVEKECSHVAKKLRGKKVSASSADTTTSEDDETVHDNVTKGRRTRNTKTNKVMPKLKVSIASPAVSNNRKVLPKTPIEVKTLSSVKSPLARTLLHSARKPTPSLKKKSPAVVGKRTLPSMPAARKTCLSAIKSPEVKPTLKTQKRKRSGSATRNITTKNSEAVEEPNNKRQRKSSTSTPKPSSAKSTPKQSSAKSTPKQSSAKSTPKVGQSSSSSPGVKSLLKAMDGLSSEEMKANLLEALDKKVKENASLRDSMPTDSAGQSTSGIPRFTAFMAKKNEQKKAGASTPDWKKIHKKEFSRWDSIEVYMEKKRKRAEGLTGSLQKAQKLLQETQSAVQKLNNSKTPKILKPDGTRSSFQSPKVFKPSTVSTQNLNLKFASAKTPQKHKLGPSNAKTATPNNKNKTTPKAMNTNTIKSKSTISKTVTPKPSDSKSNSTKANSGKTITPKPTNRKAVTPKQTATNSITPKPTSRHTINKSLIRSSKETDQSHVLKNRRSNTTPSISTDKSKKLNSTFTSAKSTRSSDSIRSNPTKDISVRKANSENNINGQSTQKPGRKSLGDGLSKGATPFKFSSSLNSSVNLNTSAMKKSAFDLKTSLSRPLSWKPHKGKLMPMDLNSSSYKHIGVSKTSYKTPKTQTIDDRRRAAANNRADKKFQTQMNKRGISSS